MGMYEDDFYKEMINGGQKGKNYFRDTFSRTGNQELMKAESNAMGYAVGLGKDIKLSKDKREET